MQYYSKIWLCGLFFIGSLFAQDKATTHKVAKGESLMTIHCHDNQMKIAEEIASLVNSRDITIGATKPRAKKKLIIEVQTKFAPVKKVSVKKAPAKRKKKK